jgi:predicted TPR repeat methyltransferase
MANASWLADDPVSAAETLIAEGRASEAAALLTACVTANRGGLLLRLALQNALVAAGDLQAALDAARETAQLYPSVAPAALALGDVLRGASYLPAAIAEYQRALRIDSDLVNAQIGLGLAWLDAGEAEKALEAWRGVETADWPSLAEKTAEAQAILSSARSDARYVRHLFDQFSTDYDARMVTQLQYRAPAILRELGEMIGLGSGAPYAILDLGCGTGLMGAAVRDWASRLDGVDLSPSMVQKARERGIYDELVVSDVIDMLAACSRRYDLIFAADTLVYLGDLSALFADVAHVLAPGGHFLFTAESKASEGFELGPKRRWLHSENYLRQSAQSAGLAVAGLVACAPRCEAGIPVEGVAAALSA